MATLLTCMGRFNDKYEYLYGGIKSFYKQDHLRDIIRAAQSGLCSLDLIKEIQQSKQNR